MVTKTYEVPQEIDCISQENLDLVLQQPKYRVAEGLLGY